RHGAPPSPDYIPGPEAPPLPNYIPGPEAPPSPDYIPGPEYPEYLPPANDMLPAEEQPLPAAVSPTAESPGYMTDGGDNDANDDGDDLSEDDADDEDEEESSDSEEEEEEHLDSTAPAPSLYSSVSASEETEPFEEDIPLWKRARFTTPTSRYEIGESSVAATARQIRPTLTIAEKRRADDKLICRLRRERRYFRTLATTYAKEDAHSRDYCTRIMDYCQSREVHTRTLVTQIEALQRDVTQRVAEAIAEYETQRNSVVNGDTSNTTGTGPRTVRPTREYTYKDYLNCRPLKFNGTEGVIVGQEVAYAMPWKTLKQMMTAKYCPRSEVKKLEVDLWNLKVKGMDISSYTLRFQELSLLCGRMFPEESDEIERYVGGLPKMIQGNVMSYEPKSMQKAIESANEQMDQKLIGIADRQADNKRKFDNNSRNQQNQQPFRRNNNVAQAYAAGSGEKPYRGTKP
nr:reverse transcriptase domain-containing protein [Tanacetum cinerariifolium]